MMILFFTLAARMLCSLRAPLFVWLLVLSAPAPAQDANTFTNTGSLAAVRSGHTATLLPNGKVLVAGGVGVVSGGSAQATNTAELFDPATGQWTATGAMATARSAHTATLLNNGKVLVAGGAGGSFVASAELYDPAMGTWTGAGSIAPARAYHSATLLPTGRVLVAGGHTTGEVPVASAMLYDPASGSWSNTGNLGTARRYHTATLLPNGRVLAAAGMGSVTELTSAELYDPASGVWTPAAGNLGTRRLSHTATLLPNGKVLVAGGSYFDYTTFTTVYPGAELYDPAPGTWSAAGAPATGRNNHTATLLPNGSVLLAGGLGANFTYLNNTALYLPNGTWSTSGSLAAGRSAHTATLLPGGQVLIAGGSNGSNIASAELFDSASPAWSAAAPLTTARAGHTATLLPGGKVLVAGGITAGGYPSGTELYDPATNSWSPAADLSPGRSAHTATLLTNGKVLVAGGTITGGTQAFASVQLYDPATGAWSATGDLLAARHSHTATLLPNGKVLVAGGSGGDIDPYLSSAELYDPALGTWTATGGLRTRRVLHTATLLPGGSVLITGGQDRPANGPIVDPLRTAELYSSPQGKWAFTGSFNPGAYGHTATLLPSGEVYLNSGQRYDPASFLWTATATSGTGSVTATLLPTGKVLLAGAGSHLYDPATRLLASSAGPPARALHTATLLPNGRVLIAGGLTASPTTYLASALLYDAGLGFSAAWQPQISAASFDGSARLVLTGTGFRGSAGGPLTHHPVVQLRRLANDQCTILTPDPGTVISDTGFTSAPVAPFSGHVLVTVFVNGIPSAARFVTGQTILYTRDTDGDGMNDAAEFQMAALGFDFNVSQPALVNAYNTTANSAGFYTAAQIQALNVGARFLQRNPATGQFKLEIGMEKSANLTTFTPFPFLAPQTTIRPDGKLEFLFTVPDNAAFFRLQPQ